MENDFCNKPIFVCSPYRPKASPITVDYDRELKDNLELAKRACRMVCKEGYVPIAPHLYFTQFLFDCHERYGEREIGLKMGKRMLRECMELWVFGDRISSGMAAEIALASEIGIPIKIKRIEDEEKQESEETPS